MYRYSGFFPPIRESVLTPETLTQNSDVLTPEAVVPIIEGIKENGEVFPVTESNAVVADALNSSLDEFFYQPGIDVNRPRVYSNATERAGVPAPLPQSPPVQTG